MNKKNWLEVLQQQNKERAMKKMELDAQSMGMKIVDKELRYNEYKKYKRNYMIEFITTVIVLGLLFVIVYCVGFWDAIVFINS